MLKSIELIDFKNHVDTKIRLQRLTLLVGPNGAGKTGVLQGIALGAAALRDSRAIAPGGSDAALARRGSPGYRLSFAGDALPDVGGSVVDRARPAFVGGTVAWPSSSARTCGAIWQASL